MYKLRSSRCSPYFYTNLLDKVKVKNLYYLIFEEKPCQGASHIKGTYVVFVIIPMITEKKLGQRNFASGYLSREQLNALHCFKLILSNKSHFFQLLEKYKSVLIVFISKSLCKYNIYLKNLAQ